MAVHSTVVGYFSDTIRDFAEKDKEKTSAHAVVASLSCESMGYLSSALSHLAKELGHETALPDLSEESLSQGFAESVRDFVTDLNRSTNPANMGAEHRKRVKDPAYHAALADFYDGVDKFLNASGVPLERAGERFPMVHDTPLLLKREVSGELVAVDAIDTSRKAVVCFGGTANFEGNTKVSAGLLRLAEETLGGRKVCEEGNVDLYCVVYPVAHRTKFFRDTHAYNADPQKFSTPEAKRFVADFLMPKLADKEGALLPMEDMKKASAKFNFFAYSYGTVFAQEVRNALRDSLKEKGLENGEVKSLLANCYCMNLGSLARLDVEKPEGHFSAVHVISETDLSIRNKSANIEFLANGRRMIPLRENEVVIKAAAPSQGYIQDDSFSNEKQSTEAKTEKLSSNPSGHSAVFYTKPIVNEEVVHNPRYVGFSMADALGLESAYRNLGEPSLPPRQPDTPFLATEDGRISPYAAAVMNETAGKAQQASR